jgi:FXSXX-COOH protein
MGSGYESGGSRSGVVAAALLATAAVLPAGELAVQSDIADVVALGLSKLKTSDDSVLAHALRRVADDASTATTLAAHLLD